MMAWKLRTLLAILGITTALRLKGMDVTKFLKDFDKTGIKYYRPMANHELDMFREFIETNKEEYIKNYVDMYGWLSSQAEEAMVYMRKNVTQNERLALRRIQALALHLSEEDLERLVTAQLSIYELYFGYVCPLGKSEKCEQWTLYGRLREYFANCTNRNEEELLHYWRAWHQQSVNLTIPFQTTLQMLRLAMNYTSVARRWTDEYSSNILKDFDVKKWSKQSIYRVMRLYEELYAYVKRRIVKKSDWRIKAHLVGDVLARDWQNLYAVTRPNENIETFDFGVKMNQLFNNASYSENMIKLGKEFYGRLGFSTDKLCNTSSECTVQSAPHMICQPKMYELRNKRQQNRLSMCSQWTASDMNELLRLMGEIIYSNEYVRQPLYFQQAANPGFLDALGTLAALAFAHPTNLQKLGLYGAYEWKDVDVDYLYRQALIYVPSLVYAYAVDLWKWQTVDEKTPIDTAALNELWWNISVTYTGVQRPEVNAGNNVDFLRVPDLVALQPTSQKFTSIVFAFQLLHYLGSNMEECKSQPLHRCHVANVTGISKLLQSFLNKGNSDDWFETVKTIAPEGMNITFMMDYFEPLYKWLREQNDAVTACRGWGVDDQWPADLLRDLSPARCHLIEPTTTQYPPTTDCPWTTPKPGGAYSITASFGLFLLAALLTRVLD